ncbi:MAG: spore germination protein [Clostridiales bacterium]|nr:spore germination protein [Clostridiales bacterium]
MAGIFQKTKEFLVYKEPKDEEHGFELLEGKNEGMINPLPEGSVSGRQNQSAQQQNSKNNQSDGGKEEQQKKGRFSRKDDENTGNTEQYRPQKDPEFISDKLCDNIETIRQKFHIPRNQDVNIREFRIGWKISACISYIDGMIDKDMLNLSVFPRLMSREITCEIGKRCPVDVLIENVLPVFKAKKLSRFTDIVLSILGGFSVLFIDGCSECAVFETTGYKTRSVDQPVTEKVVKGSQEGFTEDLRINITLLRRIIKNENLIVEIMTVGKSDNNNVAILYHDEYANPEVVREVKKRISRINTDYLPGEGVLEQYIEDNTFMLFLQTLSTERPDRAASYIMEGLIVLFADGTPFALSVPVTFFRLLHSSEDSNTRWLFGTFLRLVRIFGLFCAEDKSISRRYYPVPDLEAKNPPGQQAIRQHAAPGNECKKLVQRLMTGSAIC